MCIIPLFIDHTEASIPSCRRYTMFLQPLWDGDLHLALDLQSAVLQLLSHHPGSSVVSSDEGYSDAVSNCPVMRTCLRSCLPRQSLCRISAISMEHVSHLVSFLTNSSVLLDPRAFMLQRHIGPTMLHTHGSLAKTESRAFSNTWNLWNIHG